MAYKIVGVDEDNLFPQRVEARLSQDFAGADIENVILSGRLSPESLSEKFLIYENVKDYGAVGDGVTDDSVAILAAVAVSQSNGRPVYIPEGVYLTGTAITSDNANLVIHGAGRSKTAIKYVGSSFALGRDVNANYTGRWEIKGLTIDISEAPDGVIALRVDNVGRSSWDVRVIAMGGANKVGIAFIGGTTAQPRSTYFNTFYDLELSYAGKGITFEGYANANYFVGGVVEGSGGPAVFCLEGSEEHNIVTNKFVGTAFQLNSLATSGTKLIELGKTGVFVTRVTNFDFISCRFETPVSSSIWLGENTRNILFTSGSASAEISFTNSGRNNAFIDATTLSKAAYTAAGATVSARNEDSENLPSDGGWLTLYTGTVPLGGKPFSEVVADVDAVFRVAGSITGLRVVELEINAISVAHRRYITFNAGTEDQRQTVGFSNYVMTANGVNNFGISVRARVISATKTGVSKFAFNASFLGRQTQ